MQLCQEQRNALGVDTLFVTQFQKSAVQKIKNNKISINRIAKESGIARQTFYNNPIVMAYIEQYLATNASASPYDSIDTLREEIRRKDEQIIGLVQRDATISVYKAQVK